MSEKAIREKCREIADFLVKKNAAYGDSIFNPVNILSKDKDPLSQIDVRIDDKLSRLAYGKKYPGDDTVRDLIGCLIIREIAVDLEKAKGNDNVVQ